MPDADRLTAALDEIREREQAVATKGPWEVLDEVLKLHQPRQLHDMVESYDGRHLCAHSPDYEGDRHYEGDDGLWYCKDRPTVKVCTSCADDSHDDLWAAWPCLTYGAISRALLGEDGS